VDRSGQHLSDRGTGGHDAVAEHPELQQRPERAGPDTNSDPGLSATERRPAPGLPETGMDIRDLLATGLILLASGGLVLLATRRRRAG
jgi:LPXTG-motif cell wall-anchored protein